MRLEKMKNLQRNLQRNEAVYISKSGRSILVYLDKLHP